MNLCLWFSTLIILCLLGCCIGDDGLNEFQKVFEPRYSLKFVEGKIPFWNPFGSATVHDSFVSLLPSSTESNIGQLWSTKLLELSDFETEIKLRIGPRSSGETVAIFIAKQYTSNTLWTGLAIFLIEDSSHSSIYAILNDGTRHIFSSSYRYSALGQCNCNFRYPEAESLGKNSFFFNLKVSFRNEELSLSYSLGHQLKDDSIASKEDRLLEGWNTCFTSTFTSHPAGFIGFVATKSPPYMTNHRADVYSVRTITSSAGKSFDVGEKPATKIGLSDSDEKIKKKLAELKFSNVDAEKTFDYNRLNLLDVSHLDSTDPRTLIVNHLQVVERKQFDTSEEISKKFRNMHAKLNDIDKHNKDTIAKLNTSVSKLRQMVERGQSNLETIVNDFIRLSKLMQEIDQKLPHYDIVKASEDSFQKLNYIHSVDQELEKSDYSGQVWLIFCVFEVVFVLLILYYYISTRKKRRF
jgi:hypothetical protein